jgi:membrane-bound serine protease (ClpP class)
MEKPMSINKYLAVFTILIFSFLIFAQITHAQAENGTALVLTVNGPVTSVMADYLERGIRTAERMNAELLIFQLNTPGGAINTTLDMVQTIRQSKIPIIIYVAPRGANAGSAGTIITLAGHVSTMAPETTIGAASPVDFSGEDVDSTMEAKVKETLKATIRSITEDLPPEAIDLAEDTIENAVAVSSSEALEAGLIDLIAKDLDDLLNQLDGYPIEVSGQPRTLNTSDLSIQALNLSFIEQVLFILTDPNIVFLLLNFGILAVLIEIKAPGGWVAGTLGAVALALAAYGLGLLTVNWFGLVFLIIAFALFVLEIKTPGKGAMTTAGAIALIVGALVLFNSPRTPYFFRVSVPLVVTTAVLTAGGFLALVTIALRSHRAPLRAGQESLVGRTGYVLTQIPKHGHGQVQLGGEQWSAELAFDEDPIPERTRIEVVQVKGLRLIVTRKEETQ